MEVQLTHPENGTCPLNTLNDANGADLLILKTVVGTVLIRLVDKQEFCMRVCLCL